MLVTFRSKAAAEVLMLSEHALPLLQAAGKSVDTVPERGVFTPEQLDGAIAGLERAIAESQPVSHDDDEDPDDDKPPVPAIARPVSVEQRAYPVLEMLRKARGANENVMWETSRGY